MTTLSKQRWMVGVYEAVVVAGMLSLVPWVLVVILVVASTIAASVVPCWRCGRRGLWFSDVCMARISFPWWNTACPRCGADLAER